MNLKKKIHYNQVCFNSFSNENVLSDMPVTCCYCSRFCSEQICTQISVYVLIRMYTENHLQFNFPLYEEKRKGDIQK